MTETGLMVTISEEEYNYMQSELAFLSCLRAVGVDNWQGYGDAWELYEEEYEEEV